MVPLRRVDIVVLDPVSITPVCCRGCSSAAVRIAGFSSAQPDTARVVDGAEKVRERMLYAGRNGDYRH